MSSSLSHPFNKGSLNKIAMLIALVVLSIGLLFSGIHNASADEEVVIDAESAQDYAIDPETGLPLFFNPNAIKEAEEKLARKKQEAKKKAEELAKKKAEEEAGRFSLLPGKTTDLAEKIRTGNILLSDIPAFIAFFIQIAIGIAGTIAFLMILVGGYQYIIGGVYSEAREKGKSTLTYAISGFVVALLAYAIVTLVQLVATSF